MPADILEQVVDRLSRVERIHEGRVPAQIQPRATHADQMILDAGQLRDYGWFFCVKSLDAEWALSTLTEVVTLAGNVKPEHLVRSVAVNAMEAAFLESIPGEMQKAAGHITESGVTQTTKTYKVRGKNSQQFEYKYPMERGEAAELVDQFNAWDKNKGRKGGRGRYRTKTYYRNKEIRGQGLPERGFIGSMLNISNPIVYMGLEVIWQSAQEFGKQYSYFSNKRKTEKWSGGKARPVSSYQQDRGKVYYGSSRYKKPYTKRRDYVERFED